LYQTIRDGERSRIVVVLQGWISLNGLGFIQKSMGLELLQCPRQISWTMMNKNATLSDPGFLQFETIINQNMIRSTFMMLIAGPTGDNLTHSL
jgi:hypothetical protein